MKRMKFIGLFLLIFFLLQTFAIASTQFEPEDFQLEINGVLLDIEAVSTIDDIDFQGDTFVVSMSSSQNFKVSSADRRKFNISPATYTIRTCPAAKSVLEINTPENITPINYTISLGSSGSCSSSNDGGGVSGGVGGGGKIGIVGGVGEIGGQPPSLGTIVPPPSFQPILPEIPTPTPAVKQPVIPLLPAPPIGISPILLPPTILPVSLSLEEVSVQEMVKSIPTIAFGTVKIGKIITEGILQIALGLATGQKGSADIARQIPDSGIYSWNTNKPLLNEANSKLKQTVEGKDYTIVIFSDEVRDISDSYFSFVKPKPLLAYLTKSNNSSYFLENSPSAAKIENPGAPSITIIFPNGREVLTIGEVYDIKWTSKNLNPDKLLNITLNKEHVLFGTKDAGIILKEIVKRVRVILDELKKHAPAVKLVKDLFMPVSILIIIVSIGILLLTNINGFPVIITEERNLETLKQARALNALEKLFRFIAPYLLALGTILSIALAAIVANPLSYGLFYLYLLLDLLKIYFAIYPRKI